MKKLILGLGLVVTSSLSAYSCDQCSCASSGFMGIVPQFGKHFVGLRYQFQNFETRHFGSLADDFTHDNSKEYFHTAELFGSYFPHKRVQLTASVPYAFRIQNSNAEGQFRSNGFGDARVGVNYTALATPDTLGKKVRHNIIVGAAFKAPTGAFKLRQDDELLHPNLQPGSGSWDVEATARYIVRIKRWGISSLFNYRWNTTNALDYKFGDRMTGLLGGFYWTRHKSVTFMPQVALNFDYAFRDVENNRYQDRTGGYQLSARADLQVGYKRLITTVGYSQPLSFNLSNGEVSPKHQFNISILILI